MIYNGCLNKILKILYLYVYGGIAKKSSESAGVQEWMNYYCKLPNSGLKSHVQALSQNVIINKESDHIMMNII